MPELLENQTGDLAKSQAKKRIHTIPAHIETLYIFLCPEERKPRVPNEAQFSERSGTAGIRRFRSKCQATGMDDRTYRNENIDEVSTI
jgi:hypothetical protein